MIELSALEARRIALSAQRSGMKRPAAPRVVHVLAVARRLHALQIDTVNVLTRADYLPIYSRRGPYRVRDLDRLTNKTQEMPERAQIELGLETPTAPRYDRREA